MLKEIEILKINMECKKCKRFIYNTGNCNGRENYKIPCTIFLETKSGTRQ